MTCIAVTNPRPAVWFARRKVADNEINTVTCYGLADIQPSQHTTCQYQDFVSGSDDEVERVEIV